MLAWRHDESLAVCEGGARHRAGGRRTPRPGPCAHRARHGPRLPGPRRGGSREAPLALRLAEEHGDPWRWSEPYVNLTDALMMLGRPRESARLAEAALPMLRRYGMDHSSLSPTGPRPSREGRVGRSRRASAAALRAITANFPHHALITRGARGRPRRLRRRPAHFETARATCAWTATWRSTTRSSPSSPCGSAAGRMPTRRCATAWRAARSARWPRSASGCAPRDCARKRSWPRSHAPATTTTPSATSSVARGRCSPPRATPKRRRHGHAQRRRLASARRGRVRAGPRRARARAVVRAADDLGAARAPAARGLLPLAPSRGARRRRRTPRRGDCAAEARRMPSQLGSERGRCCASSSCSPARAARSDAARRRPPTAGRAYRSPRADAARVRGTDPRRPRPHQPRDRRRARDQRQTASVHVSHILRKLDAPNRLEAAAIAHRLAPPHARQHATFR